MTFFEGVPLADSNGHSYGRGSDHGAAPFISFRPMNDSFQSKLLDLQRPIRIGRQVSADTVPTETNGFFSNKVLSRNHAELWYERGKVFIKDVKSSNGTFLNGKRLSGENMESPPFELCDGDRVEFGVDFLGENNVVMYKRVAAKVQIIDNDVGMPLGSTSRSPSSTSSASSMSSLSSMSNTSVSTLLNVAVNNQNGIATNGSLNHNADGKRAGSYSNMNIPMEMPELDIANVGTGSADFIVSRLQTELKRCIEVNTQLEALQQSVGYMGARIKADASSRNEADTLESQLQTCQQLLQQSRREHLRDTDALRTKLHRLSLQHTHLKVTEQRLREELNKMEREMHRLRQADLEKDEELLKLRKLMREQSQQNEVARMGHQTLRRELNATKAQAEREENERLAVAKRMLEMNQELEKLKLELRVEKERRKKNSLSKISPSASLNGTNGQGPPMPLNAANSPRSTSTPFQNGNHHDTTRQQNNARSTSMTARLRRYIWPDSTTLRWLSISVAIAAIGLYIYWHRGATTNGVAGLLHQSLNYYAARFGELYHTATSSTTWSNILQRLSGNTGLSTASGVVVDAQGRVAERMA